MDVGVYQLQRSEKLLEERLQTMGEKADRYVSADVLLMGIEEWDFLGSVTACSSAFASSHFCEPAFELVETL